jgi:hypothetical protein
VNNMWINKYQPPFAINGKTIKHIKKAPIGAFLVNVRIKVVF